ncbi:MAG TPA: cell wall-binding repeat-containing protein [Egibacteraceae bacterium]|nr:cell wall-binding repeat-containing protein [Egibacteraceae bacterium]
MIRVPVRLGGVLAVLLGMALAVPAAAQTPSSEPSAQPQRHSARIVRVSGDSRVATAVAASRHAFPGGAGTVVIAAARRFPDALAAVPLAAREGAPLLLVEERARGAVLEEVRRLGASRALLMAAHGAVPVVVELELRRAGLVVERVAGDGRFHTASRIARRLGPGEAGEAVLVSGEAFADALPAGPLAAHAGLPILLTAAGELPADPAAALRDLPAERVLVVGGPAAVGEAVVAGLPDARRVSGPDRYRTALAAADELLARGGSLGTVAIATGRDFADALAAGPVAAQAGGPVLLVDGQDAAQADAVYDYLAEHRGDIDTVLLFGGAAAISEDVRGRIARALGGDA